MIVLTKEIESGVQKEMSRRDFLSSAAWAIAGATMLGSEVFGRQTAAPILKPIDDLKITHGQSPAVPAHNYEFANGNWFDGKKFVLRTFYSVGGILSNRKPPRVDQVIDLRGKFIVPPFGEAHNHNLDWSSDEQFARLRRKYLEHGIFYVKNPTNLPRTRESLLGKINIPTSIDGSFSNGGLTATGGHPIEIVTPKRGFKPTDGEGAFYFVIDSLADLERKWPAIKSGRPDFIKTCLLYSEDFAKRKDNPKYFGWKGLDPAILSAIAQRAHQDGLRVSIHIESAADFHNALIAGVDEISHMPGCRFAADVEPHPMSQFLISEADAQLAEKRQIYVVTTLMGATQLTNPDDRRKQDEINSKNLVMLMKHHVKIALGSDSYQDDTVPEAFYLNSLHIFDNRTLLNMWCTTTARTIFPQRRIGYLQAGYEASFLVLAANPLADFGSVRKIESRFKQGEFLTLD